MNKYDLVMMKTAVVWAEMSSAKRAQVGAIISKDGRIVSNGYNGTVSGAENNCEDTHYTLKCTRCECEDPKLLTHNDNTMLVNEFDNFCKKCMYTGFVKSIEVKKTKSTVVHAEANAILFAARNGIPLNGCSIYTTLSPCVECAKMIIQSGLTKVIYQNSYSDRSGIIFLEEHNIEIKQL